MQTKLQKAINYRLIDDKKVPACCAFCTNKYTSRNASQYVKCLQVSMGVDLFGTCDLFEKKVEPGTIMMVEQDQPPVSPPWWAFWR